MGNNRVMNLSRVGELSLARPFFLVYLLPLIIEVAIAVSYLTGFVPIDYGGYRSGPSYGFPFAYKTTFCELLPCSVSLVWSGFWLDVVFYTAIQYILMILYSTHIGKLPRLSLSHFQDPRLAIPFLLALFGGLLMFLVPLFIPTSPSTGVVCQVPSPCLTQQNYYRSTLNLVETIWFFTSMLTLFVGLMIGLVGNLGRQLLGALLVGLAGVYIIGTETILTSGATGYLNLGSQVFEIAVGLSIAPLLVFLGATILATGRTAFACSRTD